MEELIEELTKVNPSNLSEEGLKLFNKINEIIDRNEELKKENKGHEEEIGRLEYKYEKVLDDLIKYEKKLKNLQKENIWKSKVKEKIEELNSREFYQNFPEDYMANICINVLKELLEEE